MSDFLHDKECEWQGEEPSACGCFMRVAKKEREFWKQQAEALERVLSIFWTADILTIGGIKGISRDAVDAHRKAVEAFGKGE